MRDRENILFRKRKQLVSDVDGEYTSMDVVVSIAVVRLLESFSNTELRGIRHAKPRFIVYA